ncbi:DUF2868 domain-containing protein [Porticoccus sp. W117]|uniref:DUF2868 domain-containing protein n=1 Tax=Porticoccus sp. W117 TaxID=3054777 RepID=UPI0025918C8B|nr:DUF2868 domain-containing protein [Porticoccus sp. W117]MDM3871932.1 DUF2868 domain-containing protein [Porticoccus sp. W117]
MSTLLPDYRLPEKRLPDNRSRIPYFSGLPLSRRVLVWLLFRHSLDDSQWQARVCQQFHNQNPEPDAALQWWLQQQPGYELTATRLPMLLLAAVMGALVVVGACSYSGAAPINLWLLLGLFAFLPLLMTVLACWGWRNARQSSGTLPVMAHLMFRPLLSHTSGWSASLIKPFLLWRMQWLAVAFQLGVVVGFLLLALFQDLAFAWSSTLVERGGWMDDFLVLLSTPWNWFLPAPSEALLTHSHFYRGSEGFDAELLRQWWSYIAMAMITYGLLPRVFLALWMRQTLTKQVNREMHNSGDLERFWRALKTSADAPNATLELERKPLLTAAEWSDSHIQLAWQWQPESSTVEAVLGLQNWQQEKQWLQEQAAHWEQPVTLLVTSKQVPTAELADVADAIRATNSNLAIELWLLSDGQEISEGARKSWQLFARNHGLAFAEKESAEREGGEP